MRNGLGIEVDGRSGNNLLNRLINVILVTLFLILHSVAPFCHNIQSKIRLSFMSSDDVSAYVTNCMEKYGCAPIIIPIGSNEPHNGDR